MVVWLSLLFIWRISAILVWHNLSLSVRTLSLILIKNPCLLLRHVPLLLIKLCILLYIIHWKILILLLSFYWTALLILLVDILIRHRLLELSHIWLILNLNWLFDIKHLVLLLFYILFWGQGLVVVGSLIWAGEVGVVWPHVFWIALFVILWKYLLHGYRHFLGNGFFWHHIFLFFEGFVIISIAYFAAVHFLVNVLDLVYILFHYLKICLLEFSVFIQGSSLLAIPQDKSWNFFKIKFLITCKGK